MSSKRLAGFFLFGLVFLTSSVFAGGPLLIWSDSTGTPITPITPLFYPPGTVDVFTDLGPNGILTNASAFALYCEDEVAGFFSGEATENLRGTDVIRPSEVPGSAAPFEIVRALPDDVATVQYSSGSTGPPKGIVLTHRAILNNLRAVKDGLGLTPRDVSVNWIPLYHDMGLLDAFLLPIFSGCPTVLIPTMDFLREPALWLWAIHRYGGTLSWAPNFAYSLCAKRIGEAELEGLDLSSWRIAVNAAEPVLARTIGDFARRFEPHGFDPRAMTPAWGLAENVTIATLHPIDETPLVETVDRV